MSTENHRVIDVASIFAGITAPVWVDALEHWLSLAAAFLAVVLLIMRIYKTAKDRVDKDIDD